MSIFIKLLYKQPVSYEIVKEEFEMSLSSFKRAIATLRGALENSSLLRGRSNIIQKERLTT